MPQVAHIARIHEVARPLKVLIPLIQDELQKGNSAGRDHYRRAGEMLIEAKEQVGHGAWVKWLTRNFELSRATAAIYMRWARSQADLLSGAQQMENLSNGMAEWASLREMRGDTDRVREERRSKQQQQFRKIMREIAKEEFTQERQERKTETELLRELAIELIEVGYRALATKLHPDRGGTKDAMIRLNVVRDQLKKIAQTRSFL